MEGSVEPRLRLVYADDFVALASLDRVLLTVVRANLENRHYVQVHKAMQELVRRYDGRMASLMVVRSRLRDLPRVDDEQRRLAREVMAMGGARTIGAVAVLQGGGFWGAGVRSILTGICLLARPPFPWRIAESSEDAIAWLSERATAGELPSREALLAALRSLSEEPGTTRAA